MGYESHQPDNGQSHVSVHADDSTSLVGSTLGDLVAEGASFWLKTIGAAVATPVVVAVMAIRGSRRGGAMLPKDPSVIAAILCGCAVVGACLGGLLSLKDVVQTRLGEGKPVAFPFKMLFGFGIWSLLLVWFPGIILLTAIISISTI
ncbi:MAG: hypothetical protein NXI04_13520 [Planctomycetaceae bacterium]|nr:hypothetical protein [Planctomycetaceae bacterium]